MKFPAWLKRPIWLTLTTVDPHMTATIRETDAYQLGFANGEQVGAARAFALVEQMKARGGEKNEITQADIDEARKVRVH